MHRRLLVTLSAFLTGCSMMPPPVRPPAPPLASMADMEPAETRIHVDREKRHVVLLSGPYSVPAVEPAEPAHDQTGGHHDGSAYTPLIPLEWPVEGGLGGFTVRLYDDAGNVLPRHLMHHLIAVNFERRELIYPMAERLFGVGTETDDVLLPGFLEVPLEPGDSIGMYAAWHNDTGRDLDAVYAQIVIPYVEPDEDREKALPVWFDTNNRIGTETSFDLPPGRFEKAHEFTLPVGGGLLGVGGHLHDYGRELRLEDAETGEVLVRLQPELDESGKIRGLERKVFRKLFGLLDDRLRLEADHPYRVVGVYDNPTGETIPDGGMAHMVGVFVPDDLAAWPEVDRKDPHWRLDRQVMPKPREQARGAHRHR